MQYTIPKESPRYILKRFKYKEYLAHLVPCIVFGIVCGSLTGVLIFLFKLAAKKAEHYSVYFYDLAKGNPLYIALVFAVLIGFAVLMYFLHKSVPECKGGGIPRSEGVLRGVLSFRWLKTLLATFFGSVVSFFCGVPVGSEGPAVLMGTSVGAMCGSVSKNKASWNRYVMTGGAGAGFAVATGSPLSGILFALEEIHKRFTPMLVINVSISVVSATYVNHLLCSAFDISTRLFEIHTLPSFRLSHIGYLLILGVLISFAVGIFDKSIAVFGKIAKRFSKALTPLVKLIIVFVLTGILGLFFSESIYSGHDVIHDVFEHSKPVVYLLGLVVLRHLMMLFITDSGATGGIFIPTLAIGALAAALAGKVMIAFGMPSELLGITVMLGMCAFIGGTLRAPLTACVLFLELTGQYTDILFVAVVIFTVNSITEIFNQKPFYDIALENMEHAQNKGKQPEIAHFTMKVTENAFVVGKTVRDVMWPHSTVVLSIKRAEAKNEDMDNDGEKRLYVGDTLVVRAKFFDEDELKNHLKGLVGENSGIARVKI